MPFSSAPEGPFSHFLRIFFFFVHSNDKHAGRREGCCRLFVAWKETNFAVAAIERRNYRTTWWTTGHRTTNNLQWTAPLSQRLLLLFFLLISFSYAKCSQPTNEPTQWHQRTRKVWPNHGPFFFTPRRPRRLKTNKKISVKWSSPKCVERVLIIIKSFVTTNWS